MLVKAILVALVYYVAYVLSLAGIFHFNRPIVIAPLVGLLLGDLQTGIILGGTFEAVFLGVIAIGGSQPADATIGSLFGTAMAIIAGVDSETALALAVPVAIAGMMLGYLPMMLIYPPLTARSQKYAEEGNTKGIAVMSVIMLLLMPLGGTIISFLGVYLGVEAVGGLLGSLPGWLMSGLMGAGTIMPAIGMAMLLNLLFDKKIVAFFFLGFVLSIYLGVDSIAIAVIAIVVGIYTYFNMSGAKASLSPASDAAQISEEEEFFS